MAVPTANYRTPHACTLALQLVKEQFGELSEMVCRCLVKKGIQTLAELSRGLSCTRQELKEALLLLIQQNCVSCYLQVKEATLKAQSTSSYVYEAAVPAILQNIRKPRFLMHVRDEMGEMPELVLECLLEHGRMRMEQLVAQVASKMEEEPESLRSSVVGAMTSVVHARYVERAPPTTLPVPEKKAFSAKAVSKAAQAEAAMERSRREAPHAVFQKDRFRLPKDLYDYSETGKINNPSTSGTSDAKAGSKRPASSLADNHTDTGERLDSIGSVLWRVNTDEFNRRFRHAVCVDLMREKHDKDCASVVEAMLYASRMSESSVRDPMTRPVNVTEIRSNMERKAEAEEAPELLKIDVPGVLREMAEDPYDVVTFSGDTAFGASYTVNMERIMEIVRHKEMEAVVRERFGTPALRCFTLLFQRHQLEQKTIAEMVMSPIKETREVLYTMLKAGFISLQEVPKTADHAPSRTFYLWKLDFAETKSRLAAELYKGAANLRLRFTVEQDKEKELLERLEAGRSLSTAEHNRLVRLKNVATALDTSLLRLDELIGIFNDF